MPPLGTAFEPLCVVLQSGLQILMVLLEVWAEGLVPPNGHAVALAWLPMFLKPEPTVP